jgi:hypothetical protein
VEEGIAETALVDKDGAEAGFLGFNRAGKSRGAGADNQEIEKGGITHVSRLGHRAGIIGKPGVGADFRATGRGICQSCGASITLESSRGVFQ